MNLGLFFTSTAGVREVPVLQLFDTLKKNMELRFKRNFKMCKAICCYHKT